MPRITISYRRDDSGVITGRIFDRLVTQYGRDAIFRDIDDVPVGVDFRSHISQVLDESDVVLAIIGPRWLGNRGGQTRLNDEADPVRVEIEAALRQGVPLVPVLVMRGAMPQAAQLPDSIRDFAFRNAIRVDDGQDFDVHVGRLVRALDRLIETSNGAAPVEEGGPRAVAKPAASAETAAPAAAPQTRGPAPAKEPAAPGPRPSGRLATIGIAVLAALLGAVVAAGAMRALGPPPPRLAAAPGAAAEPQAKALQTELAALRAQAERDRTRLTGEAAAAQDKAAAAQKLADERATQLKEAEARLAKQAAQVTSLGERLAAAQQAQQQALTQIASLKATAAATPPAAAPADPEGARSLDDKRQIQHDLRTLGHLRAEADGDFGSATRAAIKEFQSFQGTTESGVLSEAERRTLHAMATRLDTLLQRPAASPLGVEATAIKGAAPRYARAWNFETGRGVRANPAEAVYWYGLAAADGDAKALTNLGTLLVRGQGGPAADPAAAALLWQAAAAHGETTAMFNLGAMWEHGIGAAADLDKAKAWYRRAAAQGHAPARAALKRLGA